MTYDDLVDEMLDSWESEYAKGNDLPAEILYRQYPYLAKRVVCYIGKIKAGARLYPRYSGDRRGDTDVAAGSRIAGEVLGGRYRLDNAFGDCGTGEVWRGTDLAGNRAVAIRLHYRQTESRLAGDDPYLLEARRVSSLNHPNIIALLDVGHDGGTYYTVSGLTGGTSLRRLLDSWLPTYEAVVGAVKSIAGALAYAHGQGILHKDLRPVNIVVDACGKYRLADFVIEAPNGEVQGSYCPTYGMLSYMSPEQVQGGPLDGRSDIYSLGVLLFELLTGQVPAQPININGTVLESRRVISKAELKYGPSSISSDRSSAHHEMYRLMQMGSDTSAGTQGLRFPVPKEIVKLCLQCLEQQPNRRVSTAQEVHDRLDRHLKRRAQPLTSRWRLWGLAAMMVVSQLAITTQVGQLFDNPTIASAMLAVSYFALAFSTPVVALVSVGALNNERRVRSQCRLPIPRPASPPLYPRESKASRIILLIVLPLSLILLLSLCLDAVLVLEGLLGGVGIHRLNP